MIEAASEVEEPVESVHEIAQRLVVNGYLPLPFQVYVHDQRPLWDLVGIAQLFDRRPDELISLLIEAGPVHLAADRGVPSSWRSLIEL